MESEILGTYVAVEGVPRRLPSGIERAFEERVPWLFVGSGSSYHLGLALAAVCRDLGLDAAAVPSAEVVFHQAGDQARGRQVVAISRSGTTTETVEAVGKIAGVARAVHAITTVEGSPLAEAATDVTVLSAAHERSVVQTRSVTAAGWLVASWLVSKAGAAESPLAHLAAHVDASLSVAASMPTDVKRVHLLGDGRFWPVALEGALKLKESVLLDAEGFETFEHRHGPRSLVDEDTLVIGMLHPDATEPALEVLRELEGYGARVATLAVEGVPPLGVSLRWPRGWSLPFDVMAPMTVLQAFALRVAQARGLNPDSPRHLAYSVLLSE
jgi:glucosamine--fructose-6-phosphate aminotransferase (isomerizing)